MSRLVVILIVMLCVSCAPSNNYTRKYVSDRLTSQSGQSIKPKTKPGEFISAEGINYEDGISQDEAVTLALWNNAQFQADLVEIALANADLIDAGVVSNPLWKYLSPNAGLAATGYINFALDFLWQRPKRIAAARSDAKRRAENLVFKGITLIRDVQVAYADYLLAREKLDIYAENLQIRAQMRRLALARLRSGDISELEANNLLVDSLNANDILLRSIQDTLVYTTRLNTMLGFPADTLISYGPLYLPPQQFFAKEELLNLAYENQVELKVVSANIDAAAKKLGWERSRIMSFTAVLNYENIKGSSGSEWIPNAYNLGFQMEIPIFNRNQGRIARAKAELEQAAYQYVAIRQKIRQNITESYNRYQLAHTTYNIWNGEVIPTLRRSVTLSQRAYQLGETSYLPVLDAMRQWLDARLKKADIEAELIKSVSAINYSIGKKYLNNQ